MAQEQEAMGGKNISGEGETKKGWFGKRSGSKSVPSLSSS